MKVAILSSLSIALLGGCVTPSNRCPAGFDYAPGYDACIAADAGTSADASAEASVPEAAAPDAGDAGTNLGASCGTSRPRSATSHRLSGITGGNSIRARASRVAQIRRVTRCGLATRGYVASIALNRRFPY